MQEPEPEMLTTAQVSKRYGITSATLRQMRFHREGPPYYTPTPRIVLYRISEVEDWLNSKKTIPSDSKKHPRQQVLQPTH